MTARARLPRRGEGLLGPLIGQDQARLGQEGEEVFQNQLVDGLAPLGRVLEEVLAQLGVGRNSEHEGLLWLLRGRGNHLGSHGAL